MKPISLVLKTFKSVCFHIEQLICDGRFFSRPNRSTHLTDLLSIRCCHVDKSVSTAKLKYAPYKQTQSELLTWSLFSHQLVFVMTSHTGNLKGKWDSTGFTEQTEVSSSCLLLCVCFLFFLPGFPLSLSDS